MYSPAFLERQQICVLQHCDVGALRANRCVQVVDLKKHLKDRGLSDAGLKAVLASRLKEAIAADSVAPAGTETAGSEPSPKKQKVDSKAANAEVCEA